MITEQLQGVGGIDANLAPDAFRRWARHYYACKQQFVPPDRFSPVPYFLLCRAIELGIKAIHLRRMSQEEVKDEFGHNLERAYAALEPTEKILDLAEEALLRSANAIYRDKGIEYFEPNDALTAYERYPQLPALDALAKKLTGS